MGKPDRAEIQVAADGEVGCCAGCAAVAAVRRILSLRCVLVLVLSACVVLPAIFWLPPFRRSHRSVFVPDDPYSVDAEIQASFMLEKPASLLFTNVKRLEYDILEEIGVPNSKVAIISMQPSALDNSTQVVFSVLPDPHYSSINSAALSVLRSSLIDLVMQQLNLSLTTSIFGYPSSFELLKFPGGVTVIPVQSASIWERTQALFQFKLSNSIEQILKNIDRLKDELRFGLSLKPDENVYVEITNTNGSTVASPVIIQASVLSDVGNRNLQPDRLKQLAQVITAPHDHNLGLNHSVFGKVKEVELSSYLEHSISSPAPSPSPNPSSSPSPSLAPSPSPYASSSLSPSPPHNLLNPTHPPKPMAPSSSQHGCPGCPSCHTLSPTESPVAHEPSHGEVPHPPPHASMGRKDLPPINSPNAYPLPPSGTHPPHMPRSASGRILGRTHTMAPVYSPSSPPISHTANFPRKRLGATPPVAPVYSSLSPAVSFGSSPTEGNSGGSSVDLVHASPLISPSAISKSSGYLCDEATWLFGFLGLLVLQAFMIGPY